MICYVLFYLSILINLSTFPSNYTFYSSINMITSYSHKGTPWDNASIESFRSLIKREWLNRQKICDYNHAYRLVF
ncbi:integrase core domain-containing protein [Thomasclavelia ramosa]|uniref:integrase core domain-containing protein n=1 Tax=Thomasclavelia ramosa TaxID=1547 RepID=UPI003CCC8791